MCLIIPKYRIRRKTFYKPYQTVPLPWLVWFITHFRFILPFINLLIQTNPLHLGSLTCCYNIPFKSRKRTGICVSIPAGGILKQNKVLSTLIPKLIWANRCPCKIHYCNQWLRQSTFWWLIWMPMLYRQYFVYYTAKCSALPKLNSHHTAHFSCCEDEF